MKFVTCLRSLPLLSSIVATLVFAGLIALPVPAGADTWSGLGPDGKWTDGANWVGGNPPPPGDTFIFTGTGNINTSNNFTSGTTFGSLNFSSPAGPFVLAGSPIVLTNGISDSQALVPETINLNLALTLPQTITVGSGALLSLNGVVSGANTGFTLLGGGQLTLSGNNAFSGTKTLNNGTALLFSDSNLGTAPPRPPRATSSF